MGKRRRGRLGAAVAAAAAVWAWHLVSSSTASALPSPAGRSSSSGPAVLVAVLYGTVLPDFLLAVRPTKRPRRPEDDSIPIF